jgi:hypothetical protein
MELSQAIATLRAAGAVVVVSESERSALDLAAAAQRLSVSTKWLRAHLGEFPNAYRLPGGGVNGGELRIPVRDLAALERRAKVQPA